MSSSPASSTTSSRRRASLAAAAAAGLGGLRRPCRRSAGGLPRHRPPVSGGWRPACACSRGTRCRSASSSRAGTTWARCPSLRATLEAVAAEPDGRQSRRRVAGVADVALRVMEQLPACSRGAQSTARCPGSACRWFRDVVVVGAGASWCRRGRAGLLPAARSGRPPLRQPARVTPGGSASPGWVVIVLVTVRAGGRSSSVSEMNAAVSTPSASRANAASAGGGQRRRGAGAITVRAGSPQRRRQSWSGPEELAAAPAPELPFGRRRVGLGDRAHEERGPAAPRARAGPVGVAPCWSATGGGAAAAGAGAR